jgi:hypothetical protein
MSISMIGLDTAKSVFQIHGVNESGKVGSFTQRYVKRHGHPWKRAAIRRLFGFAFPYFRLRFQDDFWGRPSAAF